MPLSPDQETKIKEHLRKKTNLSCSMCGGNNWMIDPTLKFYGILDPEYRQPIEGQVFPVVAVTCENCLFVA